MTTCSAKCWKAEYDPWPRHRLSCRGGGDGARRAHWHTGTRYTLARLLAAGDLIAIAPQVLAEFIHIVTDPRRFIEPLDMTVARQLAEQWWTAREVVRVFPDDAATRQFLAWLQQFSLGRKRLLDTLLVATYRQAGARSRAWDNRL